MKCIGIICVGILCGCQSRQVTTQRYEATISSSQNFVVQPPPAQPPVSTPATAIAWTGESEGGFNLYCGTSSHSYDHVMHATNNFCVLTNLSVGMRYYIAVTSVGIDGIESDFSTPELPMVFDGGSRVFRFYTPLQIQNPQVQVSRDLINWTPTAETLIAGNSEGAVDCFIGNPGGTLFFRIAGQ